MKKTVIVLAVVIVVLLGILVFYNPAQGPGGNLNSSSTAPTTTPSVPAVSLDGHVTVSAPLAHDIVTSPLTVMGSVVGGGWFFEASFPVKLLDASGKVIGQGTAQAGGQPGSWMSTGTVPFIAKITFTSPKTSTGTLVLAKDNPSGLPENALELHIPIMFAGTAATAPAY